MKIQRPTQSGMTMAELSITMVVVGVLGLVIYSLLNIGTVLGAKNTATNTAHQRARIAMLDMIQDLHGAVSLPALKGVVGNQGSGISFQMWGAAPSSGVMTPNGGPHKIIADADTDDDHIHIAVTSGQPKPRVGQRVIIPTHQIELDIVNTSGPTSDFELEFAQDLPRPIKGTNSTVGDIVCYITDRCSYDIVLVNAGPPAEYKLQFTNTQGTRDIVSDITNPRPFSIPTTPAGALYYRFVAAIDLSTSDPKYSRRGYKSANILLNGQVPFRARLTTYQ
jgi:prepilin-type N-terminal cleavage/methylation domain-containing protein